MSISKKRSDYFGKYLGFRDRSKRCVLTLRLREVFSQPAFNELREKTHGVLGG